MKGIDFLERMSDIDDQYILEIDEKKVRKIQYRQILSYAATFLMICTLSFVGFQYWENPTNQDTMIAESMDMADARSGEEQEVMTIDETLEPEDGTVVEDSSIEEMEGIQVENQGSKNIFANIFENIVSFFENLRF